MSFIAKNPLTVPEVDNSPSVPKPGTRGLFAGKDGWYDVDSSGNITKLGSNGESSDSVDKEIFTMSMTIKGDIITSDKTYAEVKEAYDNGLAIYLNLNGDLLFPVVRFDNSNSEDMMYIEVCISNSFRAFEFSNSNELFEIANYSHLPWEVYDVEVGDISKLPTATNIVDELNVQHEDINEIRNEMSGLDVNITAHSNDEEIHITSDERTLWNTVSKKANKSDIGDRSGLPIPDETIVDNISFVKSCIDANNEEMSNTFFDKMVNVYTQIDNIQSELEDLQTQMGNIDTALENIIDIQNTLMGGDAV